MNRTIVCAMMISLLPAACQAAPAENPTAEAAAVPAAEAVTLRASDGVVVHGLHYPAAKPKATILLFHQAGSNKNEYATIAPRLVKAGYSALAIDQRSGGGQFEGRNATVEAIGESGNYGDAVPDLKAAIAWAESRGAPVILWGSSYSSALLFPIAAKHSGKLAALFAFSPGEYIDGVSIRDSAARVDEPLFITSAKDAGEIAAAKTIFDASPSTMKTVFVPSAGGVHGSSTLIAARNASGADENWTAVLAFLKRVAP